MPTSKSSRTSHEFSSILKRAWVCDGAAVPPISAIDVAALKYAVLAHFLSGIHDAGASAPREPAPATASITQRFPVFAQPLNKQGIRRVGESWRPSFQAFASSSSSAVPYLRNQRLGTFKCRALALAARQVSLLLEHRPRENKFPLGDPSMNRVLLRVYKRCKAIIMRLQPALFVRKSGLQIFRAVWNFVEASGFVATLVAAEAEEKARAPLSAELLLVRELNGNEVQRGLRRRTVGRVCVCVHMQFATLCGAPSRCALAPPPRLLRPCF
jgi:hypothetical protein